MQQTTMKAKIAHHPGVQANAMGVDFDGKYCILGTRRSLLLINLDQPEKVERRLGRSSPWDVTQVQWNPSFANKEYFVTTHSQTADLWKWQESGGSVVTTFKGHTRVISDVDWCPCENNLLATCSIDTYIYIWDIRDAKRPKMTPSAVAGASQVKWNKLVPHIFATAHDGDIRIWDTRNGRTPIQYITAHLSKIHSLDWSPMEQDILASSGQDTTVRFWDTSQPSVQANYQISAGAPVWKARYTPFGYGMVTILMPQMHRWDNSALLWNVQSVSSIVHTYIGHRDVILDFGWRYNQEATSAELVTWSKDHSLILWKCDSSLLTACGCMDMQEDELNEGDMYDDVNMAAGDKEGGFHMSLDNRMRQQPVAPVVVGAEYGTSRKSDASKGALTPRSGAGSFRPLDISLGTSPQQSCSSPSHTGAPSPIPGMATYPSSLEREFKLMNLNLQNLHLDEVDPHHRTCTATVQNRNFKIAKLRVQFPQQYPNNVMPSFQFIKPTNLSQNSMVKLLNLLRDIAQSHVRSNLTCLEPCLRTLSSQMDTMSHNDPLPQDLFRGPYSMIMPQPGFGSYGTYQHLVNIPFPRTSGARFCGAGHLVTFMRPTQVKGFEASSEPTPRCLAALMTFRNSNLIQKQVVKSGLPGTIGQSNLVPFGSSPTAENSDISVKSFYYKEKKSRRPWKHHAKENNGVSSTDPASEKLQMRLHKAAGKVVIQDLSLSLQLNRKLAEEYIVPTKHNYTQACQRNRKAAETYGRKDLMKLWSTLEVVQSCVLGDKPAITSAHPPWASTSLGKGLVTSLIDHYSKLLDVQTLAMISSMFAPEVDARSYDKTGFNFRHPWPMPGSPIARSGSCNSIENESNGSSHRSNSFCENPEAAWWLKMGQSPLSIQSNFIESPSDDYRYLESPTSDVDTQQQELLDKQVLDCGKLHQYDAFKQAYANILDRWKLMNQKTEILKYKSNPAPPHAGLTFVFICQICQSENPLPRCTACRRFVMNCSLCQLPVKKLVSFCFSCGHGGHPQHMESWFKSSSMCATGCGCECRPYKLTPLPGQADDPDPES